MKRQALPFFSAYHVRINTDFFNTISASLSPNRPPASDRNPTGPRLGRWTDYCGPARAGSGRDRRRGKSRKGGAGVQARGAGR